MQVYNARRRRQRKPRRKLSKTQKFDLQEAAAEADADSRVCNSLRPTTAPDAPISATTPTTDAAGHAADGATIFAAIGTYSDGLAQIASAASKKTLTDAEQGASAAIKGDLTQLKAPGVFGPLVDLLFLGFDKAVDQERYNALRTAVLCANPGLIKARSALRDAARYQQISAFYNLSKAFAYDAGLESALFDPDASPAVNCPPVPHRVWSKPCLYARARDIVANPASPPGDAFAAQQLLLSRAALVAPALATLQTEAAAAAASAKSDPAPLIDAFIMAHRQLRALLVAHSADFAAVLNSAEALSKAGKSLDDALQPVKAATATK